MLVLFLPGHRSGSVNLIDIASGCTKVPFGSNPDMYCELDADGFGDVDVVLYVGVCGLQSTFGQNLRKSSSVGIARP